MPSKLPCVRKSLVDRPIIFAASLLALASAVLLGCGGVNYASGKGTGSLTAPPTPTGVTAKNGNTQVSLSWTASSGATGYHVKRSTTPGGPYTQVGAPTTLGWTDTAVTNGTKYFYVVSAVNSAGESANSAEVNATPAAPAVPPAAPTNLQATAGNAQVSLTWSASNGATSYSVQRSTASGGPYTQIAAPTSTSYTDTSLTNGTTYYYVVSALDSAGESANSAEVGATPAASGTTPPPTTFGTWVDVTPSSVDLTDTLSCGNYGTETVQVDPAHPSNLYTEFNCQGIFKSTDYGATWTGPINTGSNGAAVSDCAGGITISPTDTAGIPTLYESCIRGTGTGFWVSTDGGGDWTSYFVAPSGTSRQDYYPPVVDPYNPNHLLMAGHEMDYLVQSTDGGHTWTNVTMDSGMLETGGTGAIFFINTGDATATRGTWLWMAQQSGGTYGTWRTADGGTTWTQVDKNEHPHGSSQIYQPDTSGVVYMAGAYSTLGWGVLRSTDYGQTWAHVGQTSNETVVVGTPNNVYSMFGYPVGIGGTNNPAFELAAQPGTGTWVAPTIPSSLNQGTGQIAVVNDGTDNILVGAMWNNGVWRYIEPAAPTTIPAPTITSFVASPATITSGVSSNLTGVFTGGAGVITPGNIAVTSGTAVSVSPTSTTTYTLTVTPTSGSAVTESVTVAVTSSSGTTITGKLGKPDRVLIGLGSLDESNGYAADLQSQGVAPSIVHDPDIVDQYLVGFGSGSWPYWNGNGDGSYVNIVAADADAVGAVPMLTLYQMAQNGDGNISWIDESSQMDTYWANVRLMFQRIGIFGKPTLVNLEPDFWGYVQLKVLNSGNDPATVAASVNDQPECTSQPNNVTGLAACILAMGREYAPNALIGFQPSFFGENSQTLAAFMNKLGAQNADFTVAETYDRDAGCYEEALKQPTATTNVNAASVCSGRGNGPFYYDETNTTSPNFTEEIGNWSTYRDDLGGKLPLIWWQTPMGVPSASPGGTDGHYRDNHVDYMLKNTTQYADIGTFGIVFSGGASYQTTISTDGGEFATLFDQYLNAGGVPPVY